MAWNLETATGLSFGDHVRVRSTAETESLEIAGRVGQIYGHTTPSVTGVAVIGGLDGDFAINVHLEGRPDALWFVPALLEFVGHAPGTGISLSGVSFVRDDTGQWIKQPARSNSGIQFLEPWEDFVSGQADAFLLELRRELSPSHPLYGLELLPLGHSGAADDVLFGTEDGQVVQVHLTLSQHAEQPPWPRHVIFSNADEWVQQVMLLAHEEYLH